MLQESVAPPPASIRDAPDHPLAIFDLDGTLLTRDSFLPFLTSYARRGRRWSTLLVLPWYVLLYVCRLLSAHAAKERLLIAFFRNARRERIAAHADWFCESWARKRLRADVVARLRMHQEAGHRVILLSASPDLYVPAVGRLLGIRDVICTRVVWNEAGLCEGRLEGNNCKGREKIDALCRYLQVNEPPAESCAYGDSKSDLPLLAWVSQGYLIGRSGMTLVRGQVAATGLAERG